MLERWAAGSEIVLAKNPNYWQEGKPHFERFIFKIVEEGTTRVTGLRTGELTMFAQVPPDQLEAVMGFEDVTFQEVVGYTITKIEFRNDQPPFNDVNIRKAVCHAVPLADIMENIVGIIGIQSRNTTVPPNMPGSASDELEPVPYDLERAKELMAASSLPDGFSTQLHTIAPNDIWVPQAIAVQQALKELNIDVEIMQYPYADFITLIQGGEYEGMILVQWGSDFPDALGNLLPNFLSTNVPPQNNTAFYSNPRVDELLTASESELDEDARIEMLKEVQRIISDDQPYIFLEHFKWFLPMSSSVTGYTLSPLWYWDAIGRDLVPVEA
jgi:peptide/nickel transport system substrate-binding protein